MNKTTLVSLWLLASLLCACGQTGKLYLPNGEQRVIEKVTTYDHA